MSSAHPTVIENGARSQLTQQVFNSISQLRYFYLSEKTVMVASAKRDQATISPQLQDLSLENFLSHPIENMEWIDGQHFILTVGETASTQTVLPDFNVAVNELL